MLFLKLLRRGLPQCLVHILSATVCDEGEDIPASDGGVRFVEGRVDAVVLE